MVFECYSILILFDYCLYKLKEWGVIDVFCNMVVLFSGWNVILMFKLVMVCWWIFFCKVMWVFSILMVGGGLLIVNGVMLVVILNVVEFFKKFFWFCVGEMECGDFFVIDII